MKAFPDVRAESRLWSNLLERDGTVRIAELERLIDTHIATPDLLVWVSRKVGAYLPKDEAMSFIAEHVGQGNIQIADRQFNGFVAVAANGVGTGWTRTA